MKDPNWTSMKNSLELIELSSINNMTYKVESLGNSIHFHFKPDILDVNDAQSRIDQLLKDFCSNLYKKVNTPLRFKSCRPFFLFKSEFWDNWPL